MSDRTLVDHPPLSVRAPSFEMQQNALAKGYGSVRDWAIDELITEVWQLKHRVDMLEGKGEIVVEG